MACSVYVPRVYEQVLQTHLQPFLNGDTKLKPVTFFNYSMLLAEYNVLSVDTPMYELYDSNGVFAKSNSLTKLEALTGRSRGILVRYMNYIPLDPSAQYQEQMLTLPGLDDRLGYVRRVGEQVHHTLPPVKQNITEPLVLSTDLSGLSLDTLYVFEEDKETIYNLYHSRRELFLDMYATKAELLDNASYARTREILRNYVTSHTNINSLNRTDHGYFYFASNPKFGVEQSQDLFVVNTTTGEGNYYSSITSCAKADHTAPNKGIRNYLNGVTTPSQAYANQAYLPANLVLEAMPEITPNTDCTYNFSDKLDTIIELKHIVRQDKINATPNYKGRAKSLGIVVINSVTCLATSYASLHLASAATSIGRQTMNRYLTGQYKPVKYPHLMFVTNEVFNTLIPNITLDNNLDVKLTEQQVAKVNTHIEAVRANYKS